MILPAAGGSNPLNNIKASYHFDVSEDFYLELSGGARNIFNSYQPEFDAGLPLIIFPNQARFELF